jgi:hypothetical protein
MRLPSALVEIREELFGALRAVTVAELRPVVSK